ncbi:MAG TPA: hypothetical protein VFE47_22185 [Tepidisphaeraceae bacterium]|jgi:hypothetical protein|nr:hypothetical protein [Tepidisphaeraceae bacterium]
MTNFYANITLGGPSPEEITAFLKAEGTVAYVSPAVREAVVVFHEDMSGQEGLAARLSEKFQCPALLVMVYGQSVLLYTLFEDGRQTDAYVSSPHGDLELDGEAPAGNAAVLCAAFDAERFERRVETVLRKEAKPGQPFEYAINRHGELLGALGLPVFAAGAGFATIELGELPAGKGFSAGQMVRSG